VNMQERPRAGVRLLSGVDAALVVDTPRGKATLSTQLSAPIQWAACLDACVEARAHAFLELGPGRALAEMAARAYPDIPARSLDDFRSVEGVRDWIARRRG
jgi:[acyl-carrier-protein] S-malonyltransferase